MKDELGRWWLVAISGLYLLLALGYGRATPPFEAPDEQHHFFTAVYIADNGRLPTTADSPDLARQEAAQPPLAYALGALLIAPTDTRAAATDLWSNPYVQLGDATTPDNANAFIHPPDEWSQPWATAVTILRLFSTLLGLGTLLCIYAAARTLWPTHTSRALLAMALVAFLPQFAFLHSAISNDPLMIFLASAALWQLIHLYLNGLTRRRLLLLGVTIGCAILTKTAGLLLLLYALGVLGVAIWQLRHQRRQAVWDTAVCVLLPALLIGGWLWWRNWQLYGDPTAASEFVRLAGGNRHYTLAQIAAELDRVAASFVAFFGWMTIQPPRWVYGVWAGIGLLALIGGSATVIRHKPRPPLTAWLLPLLLTGWVLLITAGWLQFMRQTSAEQGRLLMPAILPLALGAAYGLSRFPGKIIPIMSTIVALITTLYCLLVVVPAAYAYPPTVPALPATAVPLHTSIGPLTLVGAEIASQTVRPGEPVWLTLYWQAEKPINVPPTLVLELLGRNLALAGKLHTYHGGGRFPANLWPVQTLFADQISVPVGLDTAVPTQARIYVKLLDEEGAVEVGQVKVVPADWPPPPTTTIAEFGATISLVDTAVSPAQTTNPGDTLTIPLRWFVRQPPGQSLTAFVHLGEPTAAPLAQSDRPPLHGDYPTERWAAGEWIEDEFMLTIPDGLANGRYPLYTGFYNPQTGERLPVTSGGSPQPHNAYLLGWVDIRSE
jgi:hypothetical protein